MSRDLNAEYAALEDTSIAARAAISSAADAALAATQAAQAVSDKVAEITAALKKLDTPVEVAPPG